MRKDTQLAFRLTSSDFRLIKAAAAAAQVPVADFIRSAAVRAATSMLELAQRA